ncbi:MAG TPA: RNA 2',3'-cyclic phosphodiesterase [Pyrinomonadaceae bacterium]|jgi:2'-5' RNA ligase|nr:RNA 2',3'-cyclic phosphodiesterase [Pyrinomonadaceae bacterium]
MRIFCAVELPAEVRARAAAHIESLRGAMPDVRASWDRAEKLHITVKFMGEIEAARVPSLSQAASRAVACVEPFALAIEGAGAFPAKGPPRVLWLGVTDSSGGLASLQTSLEDASSEEGFPREKRPFHPHLTIARPRQPPGARRLAALHQERGFASPPFRVTELLIIRSELGSGGSRYAEISRHGLGKD